MTTSNSIVERGSGKFFVDLGHPEADAHVLEGQLISCIDAIVRQLRITHPDAGRLLALYWPDMSRLLKADFGEYSLEFLFRLITALGPNANTIFRQPRSPADEKPRIAPAKPV